MYRNNLSITIIYYLSINKWDIFNFHQSFGNRYELYGDSGFNFEIKLETSQFEVFQCRVSSSLLSLSYRVTGCSEHRIKAKVMKFSNNIYFL